MNQVQFNQTNSGIAVAKVVGKETKRKFGNQKTQEEIKSKFYARHGNAGCRTGY
jgi:hypothetical protein